MCRSPWQQQAPFQPDVAIGDDGFKGTRVLHLLLQLNLGRLISIQLEPTLGSRECRPDRRGNYDGVDDQAPVLIYRDGLQEVKGQTRQANPEVTVTVACELDLKIISNVFFHFLFSEST
ncbi:hypothetical protein CA13_29650 [Planctomycetes bacterium CA13]|uniref:Uncharacterized protein n=1 Tax=Novipirellula herctigrandis TaxID=2527986 RepID=A0A5C5Z2A4_9BACT|nr:hypothetical protein CA13_29650 [Planctomycetes bacterium CA13]